MARYQASMRMGALNLLILIIALSLTVLSVLALVTSHANASLADKQAASVSDTYAEEIAAQTFLSSLDKRLAPSKEAGTVVSGVNSSLRMSLQDFADEACEKAMGKVSGVELSSTAELLSIKDLYVAMKVSFTSRNDSGSKGYGEDDRSGLENEVVGEEEIIEDGVLDPASDRASGEEEISITVADDAAADRSSRFYDSTSRILKNCVGGVKLNISTSSGRNLDVIIGIKSDGDYVVLSWRATKEWYAEQKKETLWMG